MRLWPFSELSRRMDALRHVEAERGELEDRVETLENALDVERARRIAAETISAERLGALGKSEERERELRDEIRSLRDEKLKSLDALNVKLLEARIEPASPDMTQYDDAWVGKQNRQIVSQIRQSQREADLALIRIMQKVRPNAPGTGSVPLNEPVPAEGD